MLCQAITDLSSIVWLVGVYQEVLQTFQVLALAFHLGGVREAILQLIQLGCAALQLNLLLALLTSNCLEHEQAQSKHI